METSGELRGWLSAVDNPQAIHSIYSSPPDLEGVKLLSATFSDSGWACSLVLLTSAIPVNPPIRWRKPFNAVLIEFGLVGIADMTLHGWPWERIVDVMITKAGNVTELLAEGTGIELRIVASTMRVCKISPIMIDESPANR